MPLLSPLVERIAGREASAWDTHFAAMRAKLAGDDVIIMSVGDPDFATPLPIVETAVGALKNGDTHYSEILGRPKLREAVLSELQGAENDRLPGYTAANVMVTAGTQNALFTASLLTLTAGDEVLLLDPSYTTYTATFQVGGAAAIRVPARLEDGFRPDTDRIRAAITERTKAIAYASPNNPSGVMLERATLEAIASIAAEYDLWVIADEVYARQTFGKPHVSIACLPKMADRTITCGSLSKSHAMTGWRIGWMIAPDTIMVHAANIGLAMLYGVPGFIQEAAIEALGPSRHLIDNMVEIYRSRMDLVLSELSGIKGLKLVPPDAGMFVLADVTDTGMQAAAFASMLYSDEKVSVLDGAAFGHSTTGCIRISFASGEKELREGCRRIKRFCASL